MGTLTKSANPHQRHEVAVAEDVGALRRAVRATAAGLGEQDQGEAELVATELATNIVHYSADGGFVLCRRYGQGIELVAADHGPGFGGAAGTARVPSGDTQLRRGLGVGLQVVANHAGVFDYVTGSHGTVVLARVGKVSDVPEAAGRWRWGGVNVPHWAEVESGDGWAVAADGAVAAVMVDGLGHGPDAAKATRAALEAFDAAAPSDPPGYLRRAHEAVQGTRGCVIGIGALDADGHSLQFAGVGNIAARVLTKGENRALLGRAGTFGATGVAPTVHLEHHRWDAGATLVLSTDGLRSLGAVADAGLLRHHPALIAAMLYCDYARGTDDAAVLVLQDKGPWGAPSAPTVGDPAPEHAPREAPRDPRETVDPTGRARFT